MCICPVFFSEKFYLETLSFDKIDF